MGPLWARGAMSATVYVPSTQTGPQDLYWGLWPTCRVAALMCYQLDQPEPLASKQREQAGTRGHCAQCTWPPSGPVIQAPISYPNYPAHKACTEATPTQGYLLYNKREHIEKAGHWGSLPGTAGILRGLKGWRAPLFLSPLPASGGPGCPALSDQCSMFPHIPGSILA